LDNQPELRERRCLRRDILSPPHEARHTPQPSAISPQHNRWIEHGDQRLKVAVAGGSEKRVDDAALRPQVRV
jgi:hypothetical protein